MSVKVMTAVFDRYPNGGSEMLLALALADHAHDDGTKIYPGIKHLADKTRQTERNVQKLLRKMQDMGWLIAVGFTNGGRSMHTEYRISLDWIKGENFSPFPKGEPEGQKGELCDTKGEPEGTETVNAGSPANNHHRTINNHQETKAQALGLDGVSDELLADWQAVRSAKRAGPLTATAAKGLQREARKAGLTDSEAIEICCTNGWQGFRAAWHQQDTRPAVSRTTANTHKHAAAYATILEA